MNNAKIKHTALFAPLTDESGAVLIITVIILLLLTLIGVSGINTASTDIQITSNYRIHNLNLTCADAAVNRAKSLIAYGHATKDNADWVNDIKALYDKDTKYFKDPANWNTSATPVLNVIDVDEVIKDWDWDNKKIDEIKPKEMPNDPKVKYVVYINTNSPEGNSVVIAKSEKNGGVVIIEAAFNQE